MNKKRCCILLFLLLHVYPLRVFAGEQTGSIHLTMACGGKPVSGVVVTLYNVTDFQNIADAEALVSKVKKEERVGTTLLTGNDGILVFAHLEPGYYLLVQNEPLPGYLPMKPFCVSLPMSIGEELIFQIDAAPKLEKIPDVHLPQTGQLVWPVWVLLGGGLCLLAFGVILRRKE